MDSEHPVIALVGSAGAFTQTREILGGLPGDFPASVIVLIHQAPGTPSVMAGLLDRRTTLPVRNVREDDALQPGEVVVVPPGTHLLVKPDLSTMLIPAGRFPPYRPSADLLLASLATAAASRTIAVVLSGHGRDGATGATAVHECGGTVAATDASSSSVFAMPHATIERDDAIDHVVETGDIPSLLAELVGGYVGR